MKNGSMKKILGSVCLVCLWASAPGQAKAGEGAGPSAPVVSSSEAMDTASLNDRIRNMAEPDKALAKSAVALVHYLVGGSEETHRVTVEQKTEGPEIFDRLQMTIIRDGFLDDSLRGDWHQFRLTRGADGIWSVVDARRAFRCYRPAQEVYRDGKCG